MSPQELEGWSKLIAACAALLWPLAFLVVIIVFRRELSSLVKRLKKGKLLGQELELESQVAEFERVTNKVAKEVEIESEKSAGPVFSNRIGKTPALVVRDESPSYMRAQRPDSGDQSRPADSGRAAAIVNELTKEKATILKYAEIDLQLATVKLGMLIEREIRSLAKQVGVPDNDTLPVIALTDQLLDSKHLPTSAWVSLKLFWTVRDQVVHMVDHGHDPGSLKVLSSGLTLLQALRVLRGLAPPESPDPKSKPTAP